MEMLFVHLQISTRKETPDDSLRKISSRIPMKASSLLYSLNKNRFQYINKAFSFCVCYVGTLINPPTACRSRRVCTSTWCCPQADFCFVMNNQVCRKRTAGSLQCVCSNIQYYPLYTIFLPLSRPGPRKFSTNNDVSCNQWRINSVKTAPVASLIGKNPIKFLLCEDLVHNCRDTKSVSANQSVMGTSATRLTSPE